jgi:hypothetical protein
MPPVLGPVSPSPTRLWSWAGSRGDRGHPIGDDEQGDLRAIQEFLDDHAAAPAQTGPRVAERLAPVVSDDNALAASETVVLDHVGRTEPVQRRSNLIGVGARHRRRGGNPRSRHDVLGERLAALELRGRGRRPEASQATFPHRIRSSLDQWQFRSDDDQVHREMLRQVGDRGRVGDIDGLRRAVRRNPRVAGRADDVGDRGVGPQALDQGVLACTGPDDQDLHRRPSATNRRPVIWVGVTSM